MKLYRPTGLKELELLYQSGMTAWPPRLPDQPIFYPVLNQDYATQIARDWNTKYDAFAGFVTQFEVDDYYVSKFKVEQVGGKEHLELWVPAEKLEESNQHITSKIKVLEAFFGRRFSGEVAGKTLLELNRYQSDDKTFIETVRSQQQGIFLYFPYWTVTSTETLGFHEAEKKELLKGIKTIWQAYIPDIELCHQAEHVDL